MTRPGDQHELPRPISFAHGEGRIGHINDLLIRLLPRGPSDEDHLSRGLIAAAVAVFFVLITPAYAVLVLILETPQNLYLGLAGEVFLSGVVALLCLRRGRIVAASRVLLSGGTFAVLITVVREGANSPAASNVVIVIVTAALLTGWRGVLALGVPLTLVIVGLDVAQVNGIYRPIAHPSTGGAFTVVQVTSVIVMLVIFDRVRLGLVRARHDLEVKLEESQRLEAVGRLAGGIAHDFNNLLTVILSSVEMLETDEVSAQVKEDAGAIRVAASRAAALTKQLLAFSRQQKLEPTTFDLGGLLDEVQGMLRRVIPETVRIETGRFPAVVWIKADPSQLTQVIMNLAVNARDAMPAGGTLRIVAAYADTNVVPPSLGTGKFVRLEVGDSGIGMDPATRERVFEPFFTTKTAGTGLGLATVHGIITQSGGAIRVTSKPGAGSTFEVFLPAADPPTRASTGPRAVVGPGDARRSVTVLLVEDNDQVRSATARMLRGLGRDVIECRGSAEALAVWQRRGQDIDVVLSDVVMPGGNGPEMIQSLIAVRPARVIFMSGYLDGDLRGALPEGIAFIAKPFGKAALDQKIAEALAGVPLGS